MSGSPLCQGDVSLGSLPKGTAISDYWMCHTANFKQVTGMAWSWDRPCIPWGYVLGYVGYVMVFMSLSQYLNYLRLLVKLEVSLRRPWRFM